MTVRRSTTIRPHVSQTGHRPERPAVPGTERTVTETWTGQLQAPTERDPK